MVDANFKEDHSDLVGLGGWLILIGFSIAISPFLILDTLITNHIQILTDGTYTLLTHPDSESYLPGFNLIMSFEILGNMILMGVCCYLLFLFFQKSKNFPKIFIYYLFGNSLFLFLDSAFLMLLFPSTEILNPQTLSSLLASLITLAIWIPYFRRSIRVKLTFTS